MATVVTRTVGGAGADYPTLAAAVSGEARDLVAADEICRLLIQSGVELTAGANISGFTYDSTRYVLIEGEDALTAGAKWDATKARIVGPETTGGRGCVYTNELGVFHFKNIQIECTDVDGEPLNIRSGQGNEVVLENVVLRNVQGAGSVYGFRVGTADGLAKLHMSNVVFEGCEDGAMDLNTYQANAEIALHNVTGYGDGAGNFINCNHFRTGVSASIKNVLAQNYGDYYNSGGGGNAPTFTTATNVIGATDGDFPGSPTVGTATFEDAANGDFNLAAADSTAKDQGTDLSSDPVLPVTTDITGTVRAGAWDIGAGEDGAAPATPAVGASSVRGATSLTLQFRATNAHAVFDDARPTVTTSALTTSASQGGQSSTGATCATMAVHHRTARAVGSSAGAQTSTAAISAGASVGARSSAGATCTTLATSEGASFGAGSARGATCSTTATAASATPGYVEVASIYVNNKLYPVHRGLHPGNDNLVELHGVRHSETRALIENATGSLHLRDKNGDDVGGTTWPKSILPVQGEPGQYLVQIPHPAVLRDGRPYRGDLTITGPNGERAVIALGLVGELRTQ